MNGVVGVETKLKMVIDPGKMMDVPSEKIEQVIGQIVWRFSRWNCDELTISNDRENNLVCVFSWEGKIKLVLGAIWRSANQEFTFHS